MRMALSVTVMLAIIVSGLFLFRDELRPAKEVDLEIQALGDEERRSGLEERLSHLAFDCTTDEETDAEGVRSGERACFAPVTRVGAFQADYLALFYDEQRRLMAVNIILDPEAHEANRSHLEETLGAADQEQRHQGRAWLVWHLEEGLLMTPQHRPEDQAPALMWFRNPELMERLLPQQQ